MSEAPPSRPSAVSMTLLAACFIITGIGVAAIVRDLGVDKEAALEKRGRALDIYQPYEEELAALAGRDPAAEARSAMAQDDFRVLEYRALGGEPAQTGITCETPPPAKPIPGFEGFKEAQGESQDVPLPGEMDYARALQRFAATYNATLLGNIVFADLWGCTIDPS